MFFLLLTLLPLAADLSLAVIFSKKRLPPSYVRYVIAFSAGIVISATFFELLPEASIETNAIYAAAGFFIFYLIEKLTMLHACGEEECETHSLGRLASIGMASDNIIDGIGIAIAYNINPLLGVVITLAVISHEIPQAISSAYLLMRENRSGRETFLVLLLAGVMYPVGALLSLLIPASMQSVMIAFVAGVFLYIGAGDLLMEAHRRFNSRVITAVLLGSVIMFLLGLVIHP